MWICDKMSSSVKKQIFKAKILSVSPYISAIGFGEIKRIVPIENLTLNKGDTAIIAICDNEYIAVGKI